MMETTDVKNDRELSIPSPLEQSIEECLKTSEEASFPAGFTDFKKMVTTTNLFVDKSLFIKKIIDMAQQAILITRPRRWGKTLNMSMLKYFLNCEVDKEGKVINSQSNRVLFKGGETQIMIKNKVKKITLKPLKITEQKTDEGQNFVDSYQGLSPVIYMSWKDIKPRYFTQAKKKISLKIREVFQSHINIKKRQIGQNNNEKQLEAIDLTNILKQLSQILRQYYQKKVYLLIDEYDAPINYMLEEEMNQSYKGRKQTLQEGRKAVSNIIRDMLSAALKQNSDNVEKGILTGIFDTLSKQGRSGLNNVKIFRITDLDFSQFYGFTQEEIQYQLIEKMFKIENQDLKNEIMNTVSKRYNGYTVPLKGKSYKKVYNPYAVISYLSDIIRHRQLIEAKSYWSQSGSDSYLKQFFLSQSQSKMIGKILSLGTLQPTQMDFSNTIKLTEIKTSEDMDEQCMSYILVNSGYLTGHIINQKKIQALIPNQQTYQNFKDVFRRWVKKRNFIDLTFIDLQNSNQVKQKMLKTFQGIKEDLGLKNEKVFNSLFAIRYLFSKDKKHVVSTELNSGSGYMDNIFYPNTMQSQNMSNKVIIHECKYTNNPNTLEGLYQDVLWQIYEKNYMQHPISQSKIDKNIQNIILRPIVIVFNQATQKLSLFMKEDIIHSINEVQKINLFFSNEETKIILKHDEKIENNKMTRRLALQKKNSVENLQELIIHINNHEKVAQIGENSTANRKRNVKIEIDEEKPKSRAPIH